MSDMNDWLAKYKAERSKKQEELNKKYTAAESKKKTMTPEQIKEVVKGAEKHHIAEIQKPLNERKLRGNDELGYVILLYFQQKGGKYKDGTTWSNDPEELTRKDGSKYFNMTGCITVLLEELDSKGNTSVFYDGDITKLVGKFAWVLGKPSFKYKAIDDKLERLSKTKEFNDKYGIPSDKFKAMYNKPFESFHIDELEMFITVNIWQVLEVKP